MSGRTYIRWVGLYERWAERIPGGRVIHLVSERTQDRWGIQMVGGAYTRWAGCIQDKQAYRRSVGYINGGRSLYKVGGAYTRCVGYTNGGRSVHKVCGAVHKVSGRRHGEPGIQNVGRSLYMVGEAYIRWAGRTQSEWAYTRWVVHITMGGAYTRWAGPIQGGRSLHKVGGVYTR